jgi:hypothetical protein
LISLVSFTLSLFLFSEKVFTSKTKRNINRNGKLKKQNLIQGGWVGIDKFCPNRKPEQAAGVHLLKRHFGERAF